jgi:hypothetical protein
VSRGLRALAKRWLSFAEGVFLPSPPPALLDKLTDELLVVASDAVRDEAAECTAQNGLGPISGKAQLRLLAWVVADARGAVTPLDKALAETVGKRLDRQAQKVRSDMARASERAEYSRAYVRTELPAELHAAKLANIDAEEQHQLEKPRAEIYVGFHELDSLLPRPMELLPSTPTFDADAVADDGELKIPGVRYPWLPTDLGGVEPAVTAEYRPEDGTIPPDLAQVLGRDGTQFLGEYCGSMGHIGEEWWQFGLPCLAKHLMRERTELAQWHDEDQDLLEAQATEMRKLRCARSAEADAAADEIERLEGELREAKAREEALKGVLAMLKG